MYNKKKYYLCIAFNKRHRLFAICLAELAQLVEQRIRNAWVGGSSPPSGSREKTKMAFSLCVLAELPKKPHTLYDGFRDTFS